MFISTFKINAKIAVNPQENCTSKALFWQERLVEVAKQKLAEARFGERTIIHRVGRFSNNRSDSLADYANLLRDLEIVREVVATYPSLVWSGNIEISFSRERQTDCFALCFSASKLQGLAVTYSIENIDQVIATVLDLGNLHRSTNLKVLSGPIQHLIPLFHAQEAGQVARLVF